MCQGRPGTPPAEKRKNSGLPGGRGSGVEAPRPNTSFALLGYPRSRKNGGHEPESIMVVSRVGQMEDGSAPAGTFGGGVPVQKILPIVKFADVSFPVRRSARPGIPTAKVGGDADQPRPSIP